MIECDVINAAEDHMLIRTTEPCRVEIHLVAGRVILHVYTGAETVEDQEPLGGYFGGACNDSWRHEGAPPKAIKADRCEDCEGTLDADNRHTGDGPFGPRNKGSRYCDDPEQDKRERGEA